MLDSIRIRLTCWHVVVLALVLVSFCAGVYALLYQDYFAREDAVGSSVMDATVEMLTKELHERGLMPEAPHDTLKALSFPRVALAIYDSNGQLVAEKPLAASRLAPLPGGRVLTDGHLEFFTKYVGGGGRSEERRAAALRAGFPSVGKTFEIVESQPLAPVYADLAAVRRVFYIVVPLALLLAGFGGWFLARKTLEPVVAMSEQARRIGAESPQERLWTANPRDELGRLAATFNELLDRLGASFAQQRQFMADASHELRTPISVIRTASGVTLSQQNRASEEYRDVLRLIDDHARRLGRIVEDMFRLARADAGNLNLQITTFRLDEMLADVVHDVRVLGAAEGVCIEMPELPEAPFQGDEDLMRQMILNLLDNSIKFTPSGGSVRLGLEPKGRWYRITVADNGVGVPQTAQSRIFDRFYRVDRAKSRQGENGSSGGAGLGLSIARWIAEAHHGQLKLLHSDEKGSTFAAVLPIPQVISSRVDSRAPSRSRLNLL